jgi:hypothetical protein
MRLSPPTPFCLSGTLALLSVFSPYGSSFFLLRYFLVLVSINCFKKCRRYVRLHGPDQQHLYGGSYSDDDLRWWADRLREWEVHQRDVFVYFNNDGGGNAVRNAGTMRALLGL